MIEIKIPCKVGTKVNVLIDDGFHGIIPFTGRILKYEVRGWTNPLDERPQRVYAIIANQNESMMVAVYDGIFPDNVEIIEY